MGSTGLWNIVQDGPVPFKLNQTPYRDRALAEDECPQGYHVAVAVDEEEHVQPMGVPKQAPGDWEIPKPIDAAMPRVDVFGRHVETILNAISRSPKAWHRFVCHLDGSKCPREGEQEAGGFCLIDEDLDDAVILSAAQLSLLRPHLTTMQDLWEELERKPTVPFERRQILRDSTPWQMEQALERQIIERAAARQPAAEPPPESSTGLWAVLALMQSEPTLYQRFWHGGPRRARIYHRFACDPSDLKCHSCGDLLQEVPR